MPLANARRLHSSALKQHGLLIANRRYRTARRSRNQIVLVLLLVLVLDCPVSNYENEDDDEDERFARPATIWKDADRLKIGAAGVCHG